MVVDQIWKEFLTIAREEAGSRVVETWFNAVTCVAWDHVHKTVYLKAPNKFVKEWICGHYIALLTTHLGRLLHEATLSIQFIEGQAGEPLDASLIIPAKPIESLEPSPAKQDHGLRRTVTVRPVTLTAHRRQLVPAGNQQKGPKYIVQQEYTFDTFVVGPSNSLAHAAAVAIVEKPGALYNPYFIYGPSGLGKTHLLHAIGNAFKKNNPQASIVYQTTDRFVQDFINAIRSHKVHLFEAAYRDADLLLIDDIQFISHKEQTQEAFFHIFNMLHQAKKQIVCTSDTVPGEISGLAQRMRSRLEWGLVADISMPTLETKIAIVKKKAEFHGETLSDAIAERIACRVTSSVRELEGALIKILACAHLTRQEVTKELVDHVLGKMVHDRTRFTVDLPKVARCVMQHYRITLQDLRSERRDKEFALVRHVTFYLMKKHTDKSLKEIAAFLARKDHSTVLHAHDKIVHEIARDAQLAYLVKQLETMLVE